MVPVMSDILNSPEQVIDALGGTKAVSALTGKSMQAVSNWRARGVPAEMFLVLESALTRSGLSCDPAVFGIRRPDCAEAAE